MHTQTQVSDHIAAVASRVICVAIQDYIMIPEATCFVAVGLKERFNQDEVAKVANIWVERYRFKQELKKLWSEEEPQKIN